MNLELLFFGVLPIVLYVFVDMKFGMRAGVFTAIVTAIVLGIYFYARFGEIDPLLITDGVLLVVLGLLSVKLNNSKLFKFQPCIIGSILTAYVGYCQFFSVPLLVRYLDFMEKLSPESASVFMTEQGRAFMAMVSRHFFVLLLVHTVAVGVAAAKLSNVKWLVIRLSIYPALVLLMMGEVYFFREMLIGK